MLDARDMPRRFAFPHTMKSPATTPDQPPLTKAEKHAALKRLWENESGKVELKLMKGGRKPGWFWEQRIQKEYVFKEE